MTNQQVISMVERFHKPAQNFKIRSSYVLFGLGIIGVAYFALRSSLEKSKEIRHLKNFTTKNLETIKKLTTRSEMLEYDLQQNESIMRSLKIENKDLLSKIEKDANNSNS